MATDPATSADQSPSSPPVWRQRLGELRHDLRNPLSDILGFTEILVEEARARNLVTLVGGLESIRQSANSILADVNHTLSPKTSWSNVDVLRNLKQSIQQQVDRILVSTHALSAQCDELQEVSLGDDLLRVNDSAKHLRDFAPAALEGLIELGSAIAAGGRAGKLRPPSGGAGA